MPPQNLAEISQLHEWTSWNLHLAHSTYLCLGLLSSICSSFIRQKAHVWYHGLRTPRKEIAFTAPPKIQSQSQIFRCSWSIFSLPHRPKFSDFFDLCLHWVSVVRGGIYCTYLSAVRSKSMSKYVHDFWTYTFVYKEKSYAFGFKHESNFLYLI